VLVLEHSRRFFSCGCQQTHLRSRPLACTRAVSYRTGEAAAPLVLKIIILLVFYVLIAIYTPSWKFLVSTLVWYGTFVRLWLAWDVGAS